MHSFEIRVALPLPQALLKQLALQRQSKSRSAATRYMSMFEWCSQLIRIAVPLHDQPYTAVLTAQAVMGGKEQAWERWNTHFSTTVEQEVMGVTLRLAQDPSSEHLGTTVWDASIVLAKYFEKNVRKGECSRAKIKGKRAIELGAGMGLGGLAFAMLGADVMLTDVKEVLPLLRRNYETNLSPAVCRGRDDGLASFMGRVEVRELDWSNPQHWEDVQPPFDYVLAADCIYHEHLLKNLYQTILAVTTERSTVIVANERRSDSVQRTFLDLFSPSFTMRRVPLSKMDPVHQHPAIELYLLKRKKGAGIANLIAMEAAEAEDVAAAVVAMQQLAASAPAPSGAPSEDTAASATCAAPTVPAAASKVEGNQAADVQAANAAQQAGDGELSDATSCQHHRGQGSVTGCSCCCSSSCDQADTAPTCAVDAEVSAAAAAAAAAEVHAVLSSSHRQGDTTTDSQQHTGPRQSSHPQRTSSGEYEEHGGQLSSQPVLDWETRRQGAMAARLLSNVCVPGK